MKKGSYRCLIKSILMIIFFMIIFVQNSTCTNTINNLNLPKNQNQDIIEEGLAFYSDLEIFDYFNVSYSENRGNSLDNAFIFTNLNFKVKETNSIYLENISVYVKLIDLQISSPASVSSIRIEDSKNIIIENCLFNSCLGLYAYNSSKISVINCTFSNFSSDIAFRFCENITINKCTSNFVKIIKFIYFDHTNFINISRNICNYPISTINSNWAVFHISKSTEIYIGYNQIINGDNGIGLFYGCEVLIENNNFQNLTQIGLNFQNITNCNIFNNNISGNIGISVKFSSQFNISLNQIYYREEKISIINSTNIELLNNNFYSFENNKLPGYDLLCFFNVALITLSLIYHKKRKLLENNPTTI